MYARTLKMLYVLLVIIIITQTAAAILNFLLRIADDVRAEYTNKFEARIVLSRVSFLQVDLHLTCPFFGRWLSVLARGFSHCDQGWGHGRMFSCVRDRVLTLQTPADFTSQQSLNFFQSSDESMWLWSLEAIFYSDFKSTISSSLAQIAVKTFHEIRKNCRTAWFENYLRNVQSCNVTCNLEDSDWNSLTFSTSTVHNYCNTSTS